MIKLCGFDILRGLKATAAAALLLCLLHNPTYADCTGPAGVAGEIIFNEDHRVPQYCDDTDWIAMTGGTIETGPTNGLVAHWRMDETSGTTIADSSGNGNTGTLQNSMNAGTDTVAGAVGTALAFDGADDYISIANETNFDFERTDPFSISVWINRASNADEDDILEKVDDLNNFRGYALWMESGDDDVKLDVTNSAASNQASRITDTDALTPGSWHHIVATYDGSSTAGGINIYINGSLATMVSTVDNLSGTILNDDPVLLGVDVADSGCCEFNGSIDDARIYNRVLSPAEVTALYNLSDYKTNVVPSGLIGHWRLDETTGTTVADSSGNNYDGVADAAVTTTDGKVASGFTFGTTEDEITISEPTAFDNLLTMTVCAWVRPTNLSASGQNIVDKSQNGFFQAWQFWIDNNATFYLYNRYHDNHGSTAGIIQLNTWQHVCATFDDGEAATDNTVLYYNGVEATASYDDVEAVVDDDSTYNLSIGSSATGQWDFKGGIDDVRIYNRALSASEIQQVYEAHDGIRFDQATRTPKYFDGNRWVGMRSEFPDVTSGLTAHWTLDELTGTTAVDTVNGNNGTMLGSLDAANDTTVGAVNTSLSFDGVDDRISVPDNANLEMTSNFAVSFWFKQDVNTGVKQKLLMKRHTVEPYLSWEFGIENSNEIIFLLANTASDSGVGSSYHYVGSNPTTVGRWNHVVGVKDGGELTLYINGVEEEWYVNEPYTGTILDSDNVLSIGASDSTADVFMGSLDDIRIYNRALTLADVQNLYAMGAPVGQTTALPQGCPNIGDMCDDGSIYTGLSPDGDVAMFTTTSDSPTAMPWNDGSTNYSDMAMANCTDAPPGTAASCRTGAENTHFLVMAGSEGDFPFEAAEYCYQLQAHGASDWYLPAQDELDVLSTNKEVGNLNGTFHNGGSDYHWSSSEVGSFAARYTRFFSSSFQNGLKTSNAYARCVRKGPAPRCANPYGVEGQMIFNSDHAVMQYCDGARWLGIGKLD